MSNRGERFKGVARAVYQHIEKYTVPQYGDYPDDRLTEMDEQDCWQDVQKYLSRRNGKERAPGQHKQDILKMIHLLAEIWLSMNDADKNRVFSADENGIVDELQKIFGMKP